MAQILFKGVPDFTQVRAEISRIKQEIASVSSTPVKLTGVEREIKSVTTAADGAAKSLQKVSTSFNANGEATRQVQEYSARIGETTRVVATLNKETGALAVTQQTVTSNYKAQAAAAEKVQKGTVEVTKKNGLLGDSFTNVYRKMLVWQVMGTIVSKTIGAFRDAVDTMKAVDDELVTVRKVTGATADELEALKDRAYDTASAYGEMAQEYLNSVAAFTRAGYKDQAADLAELATKTKLVGDTNAETAQQFLLSVDAAYQYKGNIEALQKVLDGANEIDNKYATSIEKIAEGLGTVAPIAAQAHVGIDELTAAIGTITAVTQRDGSEAARAFRALVLNIVGDTKTEIDEGVTWTTGEIAGLKDVIKLYAKDAYEAAQATGEVINPMKAIAGLAQSMKDGVLTEQKLMEMVSDIGGKLRTSQLLALIQNWDMYESMLGDYANAVGSADREIENALDSWTRKTNVLKNTWTEFISDLINSEAIKDTLTVLTNIVSAMDDIINFFNPAYQKQDQITKNLQDQYDELVKAGGEYDLLLARVYELNDWEKLRLQYLQDQKSELLDQIDASKKLSFEKFQNQYGTGKSVVSVETGESRNTTGSGRDGARHRQTRTVYTSQDVVYLNEYTKKLDDLNSKYKTGKVSQSEYRDGLEKLNGEYQGIIEPLKTYQAEGENISQAQEKIIGLYDDTAQTIENTTAEITASASAQERYKSIATQAADEACRAIVAGEGEKLKAINKTTAALKEQVIALALSYEQDFIGKRLAEGDTKSEAERSWGNSAEGQYWGKAVQKALSLTSDTGTSSGSGSGSGSSSGESGKSGSTKDEKLESLKETVALKKSELELMQKQGKPAEQQAAKMREIQLALHEQAEYMRSIGAAQSDINELSSEWFDWNEKILNTQKELWNELQEAVNKKLEEAADARDEEIAKIDEQIEALRKQKEIADDSLTLEEKKAAVLEKQKALLDAQNERNVRVFNSASGQWEWQANRKTVQSAKEAYDKAKNDLEKFREDLEREARIDELEAEKEKLKAKYDDLQSQWDKIIDAMAEPVRSITDILKDIATNATPELKKQIIENKDLFKALGVDVEELSDEFSKTAILSRMQRRSNAWFMTDDEDEKNALYEQNKADAKLLGLTEKNGSYYWEDGTLAYQTSLQGGGAQNNQVNQELNGNQNQQGTTGGSSSGGGGSNGWTLADGSDANLNYKDTTPYPNGVKPSVKGADMSRDTKWAGKTVEKNGYVISYDEDGYAKSATNIRIGSLNEDLANKYPHVDADGNQMYKPGVTDNPKTGKDYYYDTGTSSSGSSSSSKGSSGTGTSSSGGNSNKGSSGTGTSSGKGTSVRDEVKKAYEESAKTGKPVTTSSGVTVNANKKKYDSGGVLHGLGGIKATVQDEIVLPPDVTKKMLDPDANPVFQKRLGELRWLYQKGSGSSASKEIARTVNNRESHDHYGDSYSINGIRMEPARAERMTIRELAEASRALGVYGN